MEGLYFLIMIAGSSLYHNCWNPNKSCFIQIKMLRFVVCRKMTIYYIKRIYDQQMFWLACAVWSEPSPVGWDSHWAQPVHWAVSKASDPTDCWSGSFMIRYFHPLAFFIVFWLLSRFINSKSCMPVLGIIMDVRGYCVLVYWEVFIFFC